ncbi:hypothetical protein C7S18_10130 [Ahniella affigens]|uniref:Site-specific DNA-methyltransferase (adenine-specific) n=1 Tax=Ahniella affigens TaxID=2021234 RepID=A0A2P1PRR5_9GAMM|nr:hypothetical protein C7S18_10130 [Ahniella affigens]
MAVSVSPIRWAGSKRGLRLQLSNAMPSSYGCYFEPFAGSAFLFFEAEPKAAVIGDLNLQIVNLYRSLRRDPPGLWKKMSAYEKTRESYYQVRRAFDANSSGLDTAAQFWFLNRLCFNGIYRTNRNGAFNVPFGSKWGAFPSVEECIHWGSLLHKADIFWGDFESTCDSAESGDLVYLDPPYRSSGNRFRGEYGYNSIRDDSLGRVIDLAKRLSQKNVFVLLSYNVDLSEVLPGWRREIVRARRVVASSPTSRLQVVEYLFRNY